MSESKSDKKPEEKKSSPISRKPLTYIFSVAILAVIAIALIGGPALSGAVQADQAVFGEYAGKPIEIKPGSFFQRRIQDWARYFGSQGAEENAQTYYQIYQFAYSDTVLHMARLNAAAQAGGGVSSEFVDSQIAQWPAFQVDGRFSSAEFNSMSSAELLSLRQYLEELAVAEQVRIDFLSATSLSDAEVDFLVQMGSPQHRFRYVQFGFDSFPESEVIAYGEENTTRFSQINLSQITIDSSLTDAESIRQQAVERTSSFEDLARNQSTDEFSEDGGERGWVYNWDLEFDFQDPADLNELFALAEGEISPVYETGAGFRIYRVNELPLEPDFTDPTVVEGVRSYLNSFERGRIEDYLRVAADEFVETARTESFTAAAQSINQAPELTGYFPVNYGNVNYYPQISAAANSAVNTAGAFREEFIQELFGLGLGEVSEPQVLRDYVFVFELDDILELEESERESLATTLRSEVPRATYNEANQAVVDEDLFVDEFVQTYTSVVLGQ